MFNDASFIHGVRCFVRQDQPKMQLSAEVMPGIPWPPGFKEDMDAWMLEFFGTWNLIPDGQVLTIGNHLHMNPRTWANFKASIKP